MIFFIIYSELRALVKTQKSVVINASVLNWEVNIPIMILVSCLHLMALCTNHHVPILINKMILWKENIITLLKLYDPCFYPLRSLVSFGEKSFLPLHMSLIVFLLHTIHGRLPMENYMENFLIILHCEYLGVYALFYNFT